MEVFAYFILGIYAVALIYIAAFCLMQLHLLFLYNRNQLSIPFQKLEDYPMVTIQLPIYNELYVIERLIDAVANFDYPKDKFEIRILDDSTDETVDIVAAKVKEYRQLGYDITHVRRKIRQGYKAGALRDDMKNVKGDFIAIFDADFIPSTNFLQQTIPYFSNQEIGVVQTRWGHINEDYSLITKLQAFHLNVHFTVEQTGREKGNYFLQFNGTGGVWRKETIERAGGWEADTLTEDLDLSMRAQLAGYKIHFLENMISPAELPAEMNGLKSQQYRWMKGGAETAKKLLPYIWKSEIPFRQKTHATIHLLSSSVFLCIFIIGIFSVPMMFLLDYTVVPTQAFSIFLISTLSIIAVYFVGNVGKAWEGVNLGKKIVKFVVIFPLFLALSMGLSFHNSVAVIQGFFGKKTPFIRTPKFNIKDITDQFSSKKYLANKLPTTTILEGILAVYFVLAIIYSLVIGENNFLVFHIMLALGYGTICYYSIKHLALQK